MRTVFCTLSLLVAVFVPSRGAYCHGKPDPDAPANPNPIAPAKLDVVSEVKNGKLYETGPEGYRFNVLAVEGNAYERGLAHGQLAPGKAATLINGTWQYLVDEIEEEVKVLPPWLQELVAELGLEAALDLTAVLTLNFTGPYFYEEIRGIADGIGNGDKTAADYYYDRLTKIHLVGSLTQGDCSMYGAWGDATDGGRTLQLRALDWITDAPFVNLPAVIVEFPTDGGHPWASVGFIGWIGALTGMSSKQMAISEIGVAFPDSTFGNESRVGVPFTYLLRDILQFDDSLDDSIHRISTANRTCDLILGVGDGKDPTGAKAFRGIEYSYSTAKFFNDKDMMPYNQTWHPRMDSVVYYGMDWLCPGYQVVLHEQLARFHGTLSPENTVSDVVARTQTGSTHVAVYDLTSNTMDVSFCAPLGYNGTDKYAYQRPYTRFNLTSVFADLKPSA